MSRLGRRRSLTVAAAALVALVAPSAAHAATYTVKAGDGPCGAPGDLACDSLSAAAAAAAAGDVFNVSPGTYPAASFAVGGVTINGGAGVVIDGTMVFSGGGGGVSKLSKVAISQATGAAPAVTVSGASGLELSDAVVVSANGHGVLVTAGTANTVVRTLAITGGTQTSAIRVDSGPSTQAKSLTVESTIVVGGASGIGAVTTSGLLGLQAAGNVALVLRHITAAGSTNGINLNATAGASLLNPGAGSIGATLTDSIALDNATTKFDGLTGDNTAAITSSRSLTSGDRGALFADAAARNFRLRPGSPAIGQGGVTAGESPTDIDGEDRAGAPTDLGADEFNNAAPTAKIAVRTATPRANQPVTFDAGGSGDREAGYGGGITQYQWTFSDGKNETTTTPTLDHTFPKEGDASASLVVVDRQGAASAPATVGLKLADGTPPAVAIVRPKSRQKIKLFSTKTTTRTVDGVERRTRKRSRTKIVFAGLSRDANGVAQIILTLEKLAATSAGTGAQASQATGAKCSWFDPKRGIARRSCQKPVLIYAKLKKDDQNGEWSYTVKRNLSKGDYRVTAFGVDKTGAFGNAGGATIGVIRFSLT